MTGQSMPTNSLAHLRCVGCRGDEPQLEPPVIQKLLPQVPGWKVGQTLDGHPMITKTYKFKDFVGSIDFVNKVKDVAEAEGHHPDLYIRWNKVRLENWTHAIGGLHRNDFILAAKVEQLIV